MNTCTLSDLAPLGIIAIKGIDAAKFLQGQVTCDVREVTDTQSRLGAHCDPKGRIQFSFRLFKHQDEYYFHLPTELITHALTLLQKYAVFSKVKLEDVSQQWNSFGLSGLNCENSLAEIFDTMPTETDEVATLQDLIVIKVLGSTPRFEIIGKLAAIQNIRQQLSERTHHGDFNSWKLLDIQAGIASITAATMGEFTPHDLNYPALHATSFNKGCYTGQEIVARMQYLGKLKQHLVHLQLETEKPPTAGMKLLIEENREVGRIVETAQEGDHYQALAVLQDSASDKLIHLENSNAKISLMPFR